jgi:hypothetical protein
LTLAPSVPDDGGMPRFVLLLHECPDATPRETHCDLMLEVGATLHTWAIYTAPRDWSRLDLIPRMIAASNTVDAERIADHRPAYLDYEGPISGSRGTVRRLDGGSCHADATPGRYSLNGGILHGEIEITSHSSSDAKCTLSFRPAGPVTDR